MAARASSQQHELTVGIYYIRITNVGKMIDIFTCG